MERENLTPAELAANTVATACAAALAAGRSETAIAKAMAALSRHDDIPHEGPDGAAFVVSFCEAFDRGAAEAETHRQERLLAYFMSPHALGRIELAADLLKQCDGDFDKAAAFLAATPRTRFPSLAERMAEAGAEPCVGQPFSAAPDPNEGWKRVTLPQDLSSSEFALTVGFAREGGGSVGSWRGALGIAQRQIPARMEGDGELGGRPPSELRVWSCIVVIGPPTSEGNASLGQRREQRLVDKFIPQAPIEALDEGIRMGLPGAM